MCANGACTKQFNSSNGAQMIKRIFNKKAASGASHSSQQQQLPSQSTTSSQEASEPDEAVQPELPEAKLSDEERRKSN